MECRTNQLEGLDLFSAARPALDYCAEKHGGNPESAAAFDRLVETGALREAQAMVYALVCEAGARGITCKEAALMMGTGMANISGRFTELCAANWIRRKTDADGRTVRRDGCAVWIANAGLHRTSEAQHNEKG